MATLFILYVFEYHGLPKSIVSRMKKKLERSLWNLGTNLNFSLIYHPKIDGQSEIANLTIVDLIKAYVIDIDQRNQWKKHFPLLEYAYRYTIHTSTSKTPIQIIKGMPKLLFKVKYTGNVFVVYQYCLNLKDCFANIKEAISTFCNKSKRLQMISIEKSWSPRKMIGFC